jgi:hypothetical protein
MDKVETVAEALYDLAMQVRPYGPSRGTSGYGVHVPDPKGIQPFAEAPKALREPYLNAAKRIIAALTEGVSNPPVPA